MVGFGSPGNEFKSIPLGGSDVHNTLFTTNAGYVMWSPCRSYMLSCGVEPVERTPFMRRQILSIVAAAIMVLALPVGMLNAQTESSEVARALNNTAEVYIKEGKLADAEPLLERSQAIYEKLFGSDSVEVALILNNRGQVSLGQGRYAAAEPLLQRSLAIYEKQLGPDHTRVAMVLNNLANLKIDKSEFPSAEALYKRSLAIYEKAFGSESPDFARELSNLGELYRREGKFAAAEQFFQRSLAIREKVFGSGHSIVGETLNQIGALYLDQNNFSASEPLLRRAIKVQEASLGSNHPSVARALNNLAEVFVRTNRFAEAEPLFRRALKIQENSLGPNNRETTATQNNLAHLLLETNRAAEAETLYLGALTRKEASLGRDNPQVAITLANLAWLFEKSGRFAEAETFIRRAVASDEAILGPSHPQTATHLNNLGNLLKNTNRVAEAEPQLRRALAITEANYGKENAKVAPVLGNLAQLLEATNRVEEAEKLLRRAIAIDETAYGENHPDVAMHLNDLAALLEKTDRLPEVEKLFRRTLAIDEQSYGPDHPEVALVLNNLAVFLRKYGRDAEAEPLIRRAITIAEERLGKDHILVALYLDTLASIVSHGLGDYGEAINVDRRAVAIMDAGPAKDHPVEVAVLHNLAFTLEQLGRRDEAEPLFRRALAITEASLGPQHPRVADSLTDLALLKEDEGDWAASIPLHQRALSIITNLRAGGSQQPTPQRALLVQNRMAARDYARALYHLDPASEKGMEAAFEAAQWALQNAAAGALSAMSARLAKGNTVLAKVVREQQDLLAARDQTSRALDAALANTHTRAGGDARARISEIDAKLAGLQGRVRSEFPDYAELADPKPLTLTEARGLLNDNESLVLFVAVPRIWNLPEETIIFALTRKEARWFSSPLGTSAIVDNVVALRCGLDGSAWLIERSICPTLFNGVYTQANFQAGEPLPFDLRRAQALYAGLFAPIRDVIQGKELLLVLSDALAKLPLGVLATEIPPSASLPAAPPHPKGRLGVTLRNLSPQDFERLHLDGGHGIRVTDFAAESTGRAAGLLRGDIIVAVDSNPVKDVSNFVADIQARAPSSEISIAYLRDGETRAIASKVGTWPGTDVMPRLLDSSEVRSVHWLMRDYAMTVFPSVVSLKALREHAKVKLSHATEEYVGFGDPLLSGEPDKYPSDAAAAVEARAAHCPSDKPQAVALSLGRGGRVRALKADGGHVADIARIRIQQPLPETAQELCDVAQKLGVDPASHLYLGARATEAEVRRLSDAGKLAQYRIVHFATHGFVAGQLSAASEPGLILTPPKAASESDDGYLSASEIASLKLDADWVILSACNTAAGGTENAEALSGLARAFFYAGARSLLVSHWAVNSDAAVALVTMAVSDLKEDPKIGRAEALRRAMLSLINSGNEHEAHPAFWAPFVVVGEGATTVQ
jgi:CHAT domain-containing protein/tetratricopeptide (TPR) repeat protein